MPNKTDLHMNWTGVTITPEGTSAITIAHVLDIKIDKKSVLETFYGDANKFAAFIKQTQRQRSLDIVGGNLSKLLAIPDGKVCTVTAKLNHVETGEGEGCLNITLVNAVLGNNGAEGANNRFANGTAGFSAFANTGDTDPLTIAVQPAA